MNILYNVLKCLRLIETLERLYMGYMVGLHGSEQSENKFLGISG